MEITLDTHAIITAGAVLGALGVILGAIFKGKDWFDKVKDNEGKIEALAERHRKDMEDSNEERRLICYALLACLDGLEQLGANHSVAEAKAKLEKHLNNKAHK